MYRNYDFIYGRGPPPRRRVPVPEFPFHDAPFRRPYIDPYLVDPWLETPDPYIARPRPMSYPRPYPRTRTPRPRMPNQGSVTNFSQRLVSKQIEKVTKKILDQFEDSEAGRSGDSVQVKVEKSDAVIPKEPGEAGSSLDRSAETGQDPVVATKPDLSDAEQNSPGNKVESDSKEKGQGSSEEALTNTESQPALPIGPRIPAKQMWESSYREVISEEKEAESWTTHLVPNETSLIAKSSSNATSKRKQKYNKFKRAPYFKRKKRTENTISSETDVNGVEDTESDNSYPRMCKACNVQVPSIEQAEIHNTSEIHCNNIKKPATEGSANMTLAKLNETIPLPTNTPDCLRWEADTGDRTLNTVRFCRLCSVRMTSLQNAKQHYAGKSHAKRIRIVLRGQRPVHKSFQPTQFVSGGQLGMEKKNLTGAYSYSPAFIQAQPQTNMPTINLKPALPGDFANSMTPSGQYYCQMCKVLIEHAGSLNAHLQSKEHKLAKARS